MRNNTSKARFFCMLGVPVAACLVCSPTVFAAPTLVETYANIARAGYEDSLSAAQQLDAAIEQLIDTPSSETLDGARQAWLDARIPYQQTEVFRFGNPIVDEWEGKVNAWPLDEGLIDYVSTTYGTESDENDYYVANVIANASVLIAGDTIDAAVLTPELLAGSLQEAGGNEANVATGYHAIEFLLWGQDLNGTDAGSGDRPYTDFDVNNCTGGHCDRRSAYLAAASELLLQDLRFMVDAWGPAGQARQAVMMVEEKDALSMMLTGMGSLSYGELAGERMRLGIMLHDPEEEHDCFSDNTHNSHYYDALGIQNIYLGTYQRTDGSTVSGPSLSAAVAAIKPELDEEMRLKLDTTMLAMTALVDRANTKEAYDQMLAEGNAEGNAVIQAAIDGLVDQTATIERVVSLLGADNVTVEGSDSLDDPDAVFQ